MGTPNRATAALVIEILNEEIDRRIISIIECSTYPKRDETRVLQFLDSANNQIFDLTLNLIDRLTMNIDFTFLC